MNNFGKINIYWVFKGRYFLENYGNVNIIIYVVINESKYMYLLKEGFFKVIVIY